MVAGDTGSRLYFATAKIVGRGKHLASLGTHALKHDYLLGVTLSVTVTVFS